MLGSLLTQPAPCLVVPEADWSLEVAIEPSLFMILRKYPVSVSRGIFEMEMARES